MIETYGVSCSLLLKRKDLVGNQQLPMVEKALSNETYIHDVSDYSLISNKHLVMKKRSLFVLLITNRRNT